MTDEELNALENNLAVRGKQDREMSNHYVHRMEVDRVAAKSAITTLRAQLAGANARADRAEAALAAPEVMHEDAPAAIIGEIGNQIHNLGCELQNDEDVSLRLSDLACRLWDAAKLFPTEPTALDRHDAKTREKALREAADELRGQGYGAAVRAILALIEEPNAR